ncbi:hypothetical protein [Pontibacter rugosus]|uniref:Uncharacterized protein n=1 Tax=Pontibacter rugosus TaxID=1745966 RepID=A0ABW3SR76_9BACT
MRPTAKVIALSLLAYSLISIDATAQYTQTNDMEGRAVHEYNTISMDGSPYLHPDWATGSISLSNGITYQGISIMYDQVKDVIIFKTKNNQVKELIEPVQEFSISYIKDNQKVEKTFRKGYSSEEISPNTFLEVIAQGKHTMLKKTSKNLFDRKNYSSATINREVQESSDYYIATNNKLVKVKKSKSSLLSVLSGETGNLEVYIKKNSLNLRNEEDIAKLVAYSNSL